MGTIPKIIPASLTSAVLVIAAYSVSWLGWLAWIAFVPYILAVRSRKRRDIYPATFILAVPVLSFFTYTAELQNIYDFMYLFHFSKPLSYLVMGGIGLAIALLMAEIQAATKHFGMWGWIAQPVIWTGILLLLDALFPIPGSLLSAALQIIPVSQPIYERIAGTFLMWILLFAVLAINGIIAGILESGAGKGVGGGKWGDTAGGKRKPIFLALLMAGILACGLLGGPIRGIPASAPETQGVDPKILADMENTIRAEFPQVRSVILVRHGYTVFEKYFQGCKPRSLIETCSVTKSFTGALTGIAIEKGYLKNAEQKVIDFFPEFKRDGMDPKVGEISIRNILTLKTGLDWCDPIFADQMEQSANWIEYALKQRIVIEPDRFFRYNSGAVHILSGIVNKASGLTGTQFADRYLFGPLGISGYIWATDPQGNPNGGARLFMKPRDMAKFGYLYLKDGNWNGRQILPSGWARTSSLAYSDGGEPECEQYGYLFWIMEAKGHKAYSAIGYGGEFICIIPDLDLVAVIGSKAYDPHPENRSLISDYIIPSVYK